MYQDCLTVNSRGRGTYEITRDIERVIGDSGVTTGLCHVFVHHTSASLIICENADPSVRDDLEAFAARWCPDGDSLFIHTAEGPDDMPAHIRSMFTHSGLTIPVSNGGAGLGTWQGVFLWEHKLAAHQRRITVTVQG